MKQDNRKQELIDATLHIVADKGLESFAMKKVTQCAGTSEALVYKYFETKENLLYICYESVNQQIADFFDEVVISEMYDMKELEKFSRDLWLSYFRFLVENDYRTLYYFEYRSSQYIRKAREEHRGEAHPVNQGFMSVMTEVFRKANLNLVEDGNVFWNYILDTTGVFAKRCIRKELPRTDKCYNDIWKLLWGGMSNALER